MKTISTVTLALGLAFCSNAIFSASLNPLACEYPFSCGKQATAQYKPLLASNWNFPLFASNRLAGGNSANAAMAAGESISSSSLPKQITSRERMFVFAPRLRMWAAYDSSGARVAYGRANGGSDYCPDLGHKCHSPVGTYHVNSKGGPECKSRKFPLPRGGAPMPYCMHFHGGYAIHGSPGISYTNGSHGCLRVTTPAAAWLSANFIRIGTKVVVLPY